MSLRYRPSDFAPASSPGCAACSKVEIDLIKGELRIKSLFPKPGGKADWPCLGCLYKSQDGESSPFGMARSAGGLLAVRAFGTSGGDVNLREEMGRLSGYRYSGGQ